MNPIWIFRHARHEGAGYFTDVLTRRQVPHRMIAVDEGDPVPASPKEALGLVFLGGPFSANDSLPWIQQECDLIREAVAAGIPILGMCLGAQLLSKALGGKITKNRVKEVGWFPVQVVPNGMALQWLEDLPFEFEVFHWHTETFSLPPASNLLLSSRFCRNQGFSVGRSLGLQCHIEMTADLVRLWAGTNLNELRPPSESVQGELQLLENLDLRIRRLHDVADVIYNRWLDLALPPPSRSLVA